MSELLRAKKSFHLSAKTITRILKERGIKNPFTHKGPKKHRRREQKKQFEKMVQIDASPFDWLCNGSMLSLHGAIDDATGKILALWLKPTECLFQNKRKGEVERLWGTLQHRLIVDMRLAGIASIEKANAFLATYPDKHNEGFTVEPERKEMAFLPAPSSDDDLPYILCKRAFPQGLGRLHHLLEGKEAVAFR